MLRIALITRRFPPLIGGAEAMLRYLAVALSDAGASVTVLTSRAPGLPRRERIWNIPSRPVDLIRLPTSRLRFIGTHLYMRSLGRWLAAHPVDLAYVSMLKHDAYVAVGAGRRRGFPVVLRPEGAGATGDIAWQGWGRGGRAIARRCKKADAFVAISPAVHDDLVAAGYDPGRIVDLPNGVPIPEHAWSPRPGWSDAPRAAFVGRLAPEKGLHALVGAWPIVRRTFPDARLTLIGEGPERPSLESRVARLGLTGAVDLPGQSRSPLIALRGSDLFVLPSREEGMSIALLEAMALGIPLVASDILGNRKLVTDGLHGRLAPPDDPESIAASILDRWSDLDTAAEQGAEARRRVIEHFSIAAVARAHLDLFGRLARR